MIAVEEAEDGRPRAVSGDEAIEISSPPPCLVALNALLASSYQIHLARRLLTDHALRRGLGLEVLVQAEAADVRVGADALDAGQVAPLRVGLRGDADAATSGGAVGHLKCVGTRVPKGREEGERERDAGRTPLLFFFFKKK